MHEGSRTKRSGNRIVVKIGTNVLTDSSGRIRQDVIEGIVRQIASLDKAFLIVSSGAVGAGMQELSLERRPRDIILKQACAAIGQSKLMSIYSEKFSHHNRKVAQILLTYDAFSSRKTFLNLRNTLDKLLSLGIIPIINENDPIATDELTDNFGDNDKLSALLATNIDADMLIILTSVDGLYDKDPVRSDDAKLISEVSGISIETSKLCSGKTCLGVGGIQTKIEAAEITAAAGIPTIMANGSKKDVLSRIISGKKEGTLFHPVGHNSSRKSWIEHAKPSGSIIIDRGALEALENGNNLLPAGVIDVRGAFRENEVIDIIVNSKKYGKAIIDCSSDTIKSLKSSNGKQKNIIKRENLVLLGV